MERVHRPKSFHPSREGTQSAAAAPAEGAASNAIHRRINLTILHPLADTLLLPLAAFA
jgi:hypothetical protein